MNRILKTFLLWLLIAAVPLQSIAAVSKASCGPQHHSMTSAAVPTPEHHHSANVGIHSHHDAESEAVTVKVDLTQHLAGKASSGHQLMKKTSCSACAACCFGAVAPPSSMSPTAILSSIEAALPVLQSFFTGYIPAGLERPPKPFYA